MLFVLTEVKPFIRCIGSDLDYSWKHFLAALKVVIGDRDAVRKGTY